jgi:hypothetical protein
MMMREGGGGSIEQPYLAPEEENSFPPTNLPGDNRAIGPGGGPGQDWRHMEGPKVPLMELFSYVRNSKFTMLKAALDYLPNKKFDKSLVQAAYIPQNGTVYVDGYERLAYHINKVDDYGNTLLSVSCQNSNAQICKYLIAKGANANHQVHLFAYLYIYIYTYIYIPPSLIIIRMWPDKHPHILPLRSSPSSCPNGSSSMEAMIP